MNKHRPMILLLSVILIWNSFMIKAEAEPSLTSPSYVLMESSTGKIICEKNATERRSPASITKIMTLLLTFEAIRDEKVHLTDDCLTSEYASSMGGSQVFLAQGEVQSLETMIKCIVVSSGNDASVAVAEHVAGSEEAFVNKMNEKAISLGMNDTHFEDCCGLSDSDNHYTCARDVAIMARELTVNFPEIFQYSKIWMEDIVHETNKGSNIFTLSSTNKLLKQYQFATGLKTGSTSKAKYCITATASKDGIDLIAVILGAEDPKKRFSEAQTLLTYGFGICRLYVDEDKPEITHIKVDRGIEKEVEVMPEKQFRYLDTEGKNLLGIESHLEVPGSVEAPVVYGEELGNIVYFLEGEKIGQIALIAAGDVRRAGFIDYLTTALGFFLL